MTELPLLVLALAFAVWPVGSAATVRLRALTGGPARPPALVSPRRSLRAGNRLVLPAMAAATVTGASASILSGARLPVLPATAGAIAGAAASFVAGRATSSRRRQREKAALAELVGALAADLRAGQQPAHALAALRTADPRAGLLHGSVALAAVWAVSERSGAPAAAVLDRVEEDLRATARQQREVGAQLAGARSTAGLLALLPLLGIGLGAAMGADPLYVLLGTPAGQLALLVGVGLDAAGLLWTSRIVAAAGGDR